MPGLFGPSAGALLDAEPPRPGDRILDVGCGTGLVALQAAERLRAAGSVAGIDINPGMLELARSLPGAEAVEWRVGDATALPYADASLDLVYCHHTLQFVPERGRALSEMRRVLTPGGRLAVAVWGAVETSPAYVALGAGLTRHVSKEVGRAVTGAPFALSDAAHLASLIIEAGFGEADVRSLNLHTRFSTASDFLAGVLPLTMAVIPAAAEMTDEQVRRVTDAVVSELEPFQRPSELASPIELHIGRATAG